MSDDVRILGAAGVAFLALWWWFRRPVAAGLTPTVTTSYGVDLSPYGGPTSYPEPIQQFARAIARQEGFYIAGSIAQRGNNPGNLKRGLPVVPGTQITAFGSADAGWAALHRQLWLIVNGGSDYYDLSMSIEEMARTWTTTEQGPWGRNVAAYLGVAVTTPLYAVLV